jgi:hypothetical protein
MPSDRFAGGALWKSRGNYQPRQSAGIDYYIKTDPASRRVAASMSTSSPDVPRRIDRVPAMDRSPIGNPTRADIAPRGHLAKRLAT